MPVLTYYSPVLSGNTGSCTSIPIPAWRQVLIPKSIFNGGRPTGKCHLGSGMGSVGIKYHEFTYHSRYGPLTTLDNCAHTIRKGGLGCLPIMNYGENECFRYGINSYVCGWCVQVWLLIHVHKEDMNNLSSIHHIHVA